MFNLINVPRICHICNRVRPGQRAISTSRQVSSKATVSDLNSTEGPETGPLNYSRSRSRTSTAAKPLVRAGKRAFLNQYQYGNGNANANTNAVTNGKAETEFNDSVEGCSRREIRGNDQATAHGRRQSKGKAISNSVPLPTPMTMPIGLSRVQEDDVVSSSQVTDVAKSRIKFIGTDLETSLPKIFTTKLPIYRCPLFNLRAFPTHLLPPRRPPPFPDFQQTSARMTWPGTCVYLNVVSSKAQVSKLAVERNRARRRLRSVIEGVIDGSLGGLGDEGPKMVTPEYAYVASVTAAIHDAPHDEIITQVIEGFKHLKRVQPWRNVRSVGLLQLPEPRYIYNAGAE